MNQTPQTLKGFRDFLPEEKRKRDYVLGKIKETFELFGFEPIETPTLEYADLLLGKYGAEADKLVYTFEDRGDRRVGLRYDQTVPTARVLGQYQNELPRYFRRYQTQNVFRADKPQKGRYREFTQADIDIFGSTSPIADAEILACTYAAYKNIGFENIKIKINDRQTLLSTLEPFTTESVSVFSIIQTIDKLDKQTIDEVTAELVSKGLDAAKAGQVIEAINQASLSENLTSIISQAKSLGIPESNLEFSPTLARGLDYYTGMIFEVIIPEFTVGSVGGGGRYDNLIQDLTGQQMPAVGIAFGFDRTVEAAIELGLIPNLSSSAKVLVTVFDEQFQTQSLQAASRLRQAGVATELYPSVDNLGKQFRLAGRKNIPYVVIIGQDEADQNKVALKNMATGEQQTLPLDEAIAQIKNMQ